MTERLGWLVRDQKFINDRRRRQDYKSSEDVENKKRIEKKEEESKDVAMTMVNNVKVDAPLDGTQNERTFMVQDSKPTAGV